MATEVSSLAAPAGGSAPGGRTIGATWRRACESGRLDPAYLVERRGTWEPVSWDEAWRRVDELAHGLLALGVKPGERFSILAGTSLEWALLDFALARLGVPVVPVYATSSDRDCAYILRHSEAVGIVVETEDQRARIEALRGELPALRTVAAFSDLDALAESGRAHAAEHPTAVEEAERATTEDDLLMIVYTSGTTGPPKGCMMLHKNYVAVVEALEQIDQFHERGEVCLLFLPLAHTYAQLTLYAAARIGFTIAFCADMQRIPEAIAGVRPTTMPSVPRVYEKVHGAILAQFDAATGAKRRIVDWALSVGRRASALRRDGKKLPPALALQHRLADRLVYAKVKEKLGGRLRFGISGAAPISVEILEFFAALDILILEGYGLTESSSGCSVNRPSSYRFGTVGPPLPGVEVRIADDGEILMRGDNVFAGYYKEEEATREALDEEGWLHTGDVGTLDDGFLRITDRKKDIIVTAGGKNVAPQNVENELKASKFVSQAIAVGDRRPYLVALLTLDPVEVGAWAAEQRVEVAPEDYPTSPRVRALVQGIVDEVNARRASYEQIKRFVVLPRDFSQSEGEVTPTLKLRRRQITDNFAPDIEALYAAPRDVPEPNDA
ncbi:MAG: AMP-dependent synthetase/ligase [Pseudomonadota bacterium]